MLIFLQPVKAVPLRTKLQSISLFILLE